MGDEENPRAAPLLKLADQVQDLFYFLVELIIKLV
jgi:hypothetical protein